MKKGLKIIWGGSLANFLRVVWLLLRAFCRSPRYCVSMIRSARLFYSLPQSEQDRLAKELRDVDG